MILRNPEASTFWGTVLGKDLTRKHTIARVLLSLVCGVTVPLLVGGLVLELPKYFYQFAAPIIALLTYLWGYVWCIAPGLRREMEGRLEEEEKDAIS